MHLKNERQIYYNLITARGGTKGVTHTEKHTEKKIHYAWVILLCCCAIQAGTLGAVSNCKGVFFDAVCQDLDMPLGVFTTQGIFGGITSALVTPAALKLLKRFRMNRVLFGACLLYTGMQFAMSFLGGSAWSWYLLAVLQAVGGAFLLFLPVPIIINRWFRKKKGLAMAVAASFSGLSGMLLNPVYASVTERWGWRYGYRFSAVLAFLVTGPLLLAALRDTPQMKGLKPYGETEEEMPGGGEIRHGERLDGRGRILFVCLLLTAVCLSCGSCFQSHLTKYGITLGLPLSISSFLPSAAMLGSVIMKPVMGILVDKINSYRTAFAAFVMNAMGFALFWFSGASRFCLYAASLLCGVSMAGNVVLFPLLARDSLREYDYERYYAYLSMVISMTGVTCEAVFGYIFDFTGSYRAVFMVLIVIASVNLGSLLLMRIKRASAMEP